MNISRLSGIANCTAYSADATETSFVLLIKFLLSKYAMSFCRFQGKTLLCYRLYRIYSCIKRAPLPPPLPQIWGKLRSAHYNVFSTGWNFFSFSSSLHNSMNESRTSNFHQTKQWLCSICFILTLLKICFVKGTI